MRREPDAMQSERAYFPKCELKASFVSGAPLRKVLCVRLPFENLELSLDPYLTKLAVDPHGVGQQQVACSRRQDRGGKPCTSP